MKLIGPFFQSFLISGITIMITAPRLLPFGGRPAVGFGRKLEEMNPRTFPDLPIRPRTLDVDQKTSKITTQKSNKQIWGRPLLPRPTPDVGKRVKMMEIHARTAKNRRLTGNSQDFLFFTGISYIFLFFVIFSLVFLLTDTPISPQGTYSSGPRCLVPFVMAFSGLDGRQRQMCGREGHAPSAWLLAAHVLRGLPK